MCRHMWGVSACSTSPPFLHLNFHSTVYLDVALTRIEINTSNEQVEVSDCYEVVCIKTSIQARPEFIDRLKVVGSVSNH